MKVSLLGASSKNLNFRALFKTAVKKEGRLEEHTVVVKIMSSLNGNKLVNEKKLFLRVEPV